MEFRPRLWSALSVALLGAACGQGEIPNEGRPPAQQSEAGEAALGEGGGEAGESGEAGVSFEAVARDPVAYLQALAVVEAHVRAARDAYASGEKQAAGELFAHPVAEVLTGMGPVFQAQGVSDFSGLLLEASGAALDGREAAAINTQTEQILAALQAAAAKAPAGSASAGEIAAKVAADQIERAAAMYRIAAQDQRLEPYLDGYGFYRTAEASFHTLEPAIAKENPAAATAIREALAALARAYPEARRPQPLPGDPAQLTAAASRVSLETGG